MEMDYILKYFIIKRFFCFLDEFCWYLFLIYCYKHRLRFPLIVGIIFGIFMILTSYKNLEILEKIIFDHHDIEFNQHTLYPFI